MLFVDGGNDRVGIGGTGASFGQLGVENAGDAQIDLFSNVGSGAEGKAEIFFSSDSGSDHVSMASIVMQQDGAGDRKGEILFNVSDNGGPATAVTIANNKNVIFGAGLAIGGTGSANTMSDYEEGTWTPTISGTSGGPSGVNFHSRAGFYTKIGRAVFFNAFVEMQNFSSGPSGTGIITGLPFNSANVTANYASVTIGYTVNFTATDAPKMGYINVNSSQIVLKTSASDDARNNTNANVNAGNFSGDEGIMVKGHYYV